MRQTIWCAITCLVVLGLARGQSDKPSSGRYQLVSASVVESEHFDNTNSIAPGVFLLDTETGHIWRYQPPFEFKSEGKTGQTTEYFAPVFIAQTKEEARQFVLNSMQDISKFLNQSAPKK